MPPIRWAVLGPGRIARSFAAGLREAPGAELVAVASRDRARAETFAAEFGAVRAHDRYADLAADPEVDAVYAGTPHALHHDHTLLCLEAGKHVLCEKPLALGAAQGERMVASARAIGAVRAVVADFGFRAAPDPASRLVAPELGGGALLDLGV